MTIVLRTLGALDVLGLDPPHAVEVYSRPKPLALLVYLALARPGGFQSQDALLALFWPESDAPRAQLSLRQAMHVLKRTLGSGVITRRARSEIGVDATRVTCDAVCFEEACRSGNAEQALDVYQGEFLPGFYVNDAPAFERWLSAERARLHDLAIVAVRSLVARSEADGNVAATSRWASRWLQLAPVDKHCLHIAMRAMVAAGDTASAIRAYHAYAALIADDDETPDSELSGFAAQLVERAASIHVDPSAWNSDLARAQPVPFDRALPSRAPDVRAAPPTEPHVQSVRLQAVTQRRASLIAAALIVVTAGALVLAGRLPDTFRATRNPAPRGTRIAVLPFTVRGDSTIAYLRDGMVDLLSAKLDGVYGLSIVDPPTVFAYERSHGPITDDARRARDVARALAAGQYVMGSVIKAGGRIAISASLYDGSGTRRATISGDARTETELIPVVDNLVRDLLAAQFLDAPARLDRLAATTTSSLPALKAFLEGERAMRVGQGALAVESFRTAIREDSTFALAHYRLSTTALWSTQPALVQRSIALAMRYADRLPQHERLTLDARALVNRGAAEEADRLYRNIVATYPDDVDAWTQLGELLFHTGPWRGVPLMESRAAFEQVIARQPADVNALLHLTRIATLERRPAEVASLVQRALALEPERDAALELRGLRASALHDATDRQRLLDSLHSDAGGSGVDDDVRLMAWRIATYSDDPDEGQAIVASLVSPRNNAKLRMYAHALLAHMNASRGQLQAAERDIDAVEQIDRHFAAELRANVALDLPASLTTDERLHVMHELARPDEPAAFASADNALTRDRMRGARRLYLGGVLALDNADTVTTRERERALAAIGREHGVDAELALHLAHELDARILWRLGKATDALAVVEAGWPHGGPRASLPLYQGDAYAQAHERFFRAELLMALGRDTEALRWLASVSDDQGASLMLSAPVHLARARIAVRQRDRVTAVREYDRARALWSDADAILLTTMRDTRDRIAMLHVSDTLSGDRTAH